jgi:hypothetical protein
MEKTMAKHKDGIINDAIADMESVMSPEAVS